MIRELTEENVIEGLEHSGTHEQQRDKGTSSFPLSPSVFVYRVG